MAMAGQLMFRKKDRAFGDDIVCDSGNIDDSCYYFVMCLMRLQMPIVEIITSQTALRLLDCAKAHRSILTAISALDDVGVRFINIIMVLVVIQLNRYVRS